MVAQERFSSHHCSKRSTNTKTPKHINKLSVYLTAKKGVLINLNAQTEQTAFQSTAQVFRIGYYVSKNNKPSTDFESLIDLQQAISIDMGRVLHSKTIALEINGHASSQMRKKLLSEIIERRSKIKVLAD